MLRGVLGCILLHCAAGGLAAQTSTPRLIDPREYGGCYELRLFEWSSPEGQAAAASIPDRVQLTMTSLPPTDNAVVFVLGPVPGYGSSDYRDERWSFSFATDSLRLTWSNGPMGVEAVIAMRGSFEAWRLAGRATAWNDPTQAADVRPRGRAAGRSVDCER